MKRRIAVLLCVLLCAFSLTACSSSNASSDMTQQAESYAPGAVELVKELVNSDSLEQFVAVEAEFAESAKSLWSAWEGVQGELGAVSVIDEASVKSKYESQNKLYIISVEGSFEKRGADIAVTFNKEGELEAIAFNPNYTFGEKMAKAGMNTIMGLGVVFVMLVLISLLIYCFKFIHEAEERAQMKAAAKNAPAVPATPVAEVVEEEDLTDDLELVAVIAAAIAAAEGTSPNGLVVRSIKRVGKNNWKRA